MTPPSTAFERARRKAFLRLLPLLFLSYVIAYVDRSNVAIAKLTMSKDMPAFDNEVIGLGFGMFFLGYFLLEVPGSLLVERWSARKWLSRIMISWGVLAALTAAVKTPTHFYMVRFLLGLAEAGFYPGVIVYLTHWFTARDRAKAMAYFFVAGPVAQVVSPKLSNGLLKIGTDEVVQGVAVHHPELLGLEGWQWVYIVWGLPAVVLGVLVLLFLTDRPAKARWLTADERAALEDALQRELAEREGKQHMTLVQALTNRKVLLLSVAYFFVVTCNYGIEAFMPSILADWYHLKLDAVTWLVILPPMGAVVGQLVNAWSSDRTRERRLHTAVPILLGVSLLALTPWSRGNLALTVGLFLLSLMGMKAYLPAFWALPTLFLTKSAAAGSIGFINSVGNLGGFLGPTLIGSLQRRTGSFERRVYVLCASACVSAVMILLIGIGRRQRPDGAP